MKSDEALLAAMDGLCDSRVSYMIVGALSCNVYTFPRSTQDADVVFRADARVTDALMAALGAKFRAEPRSAAVPYAFENHETPFKVELYPLGDDAHDQESFLRRHKLVVASRETFVPTAEDVVINKLRWSGVRAPGKHVDDARNVIAAQQELLDWPYIERWCDQHGTRGLLEEIRRSIPPL